MAGILYHAVQLKPLRYVGRDGREHYELELVDGDSDSITRDSWERIVRAAETLGIPQECWPVYPSGIDVPLSDVETRNQVLRRHAERCSETSIDCPRLAQIISWIRQGQQVIYCRV